MAAEVVSTSKVDASWWQRSLLGLVDTGLTPGGQYTYRVRAVDGVSLAEDDNPVIHPGWTTGPQEVQFSDSAEGDLDEWFTALGSSADSGTEPWVVVDDDAHGGSRSWFCRNEPRIKDQVVGLTPEFEITDATTELAFHHLFDLEPFWDGGRLEYSTDGGATWSSVTAVDRPRPLPRTRARRHRAG